MFEGVDVQAHYFHDTRLLIFIGCMLVGATLLAGTYPAFYVSRFSPTTIFRGTVKFGNSNLFSRLMLGLQLSIAIITVIASIAFARNAAFQRNYDYGYNIEGNMGVLLDDSVAYTALKNQLSSVPGITGVAGASHHIGFAYRNAVAESGGIKKEVNYLEVGRGYTETMGLKIVAGRGFDAGLESDYKDAILITQKMAAIYGWNASQAPGKQIRLDSADYTVVGTLKDFHPASLFDLAQPLAMKLVKENKLRFLVVEAKAGDLTDVFGKVKDAWKGLFPLRPFNGFYQNQLKAKAYQVSNSIATIFEWFGIVSILLTATGLFALVSLTTLKKMKEIALRKVVGAGPRHILLLINKGYIWIFLVAAALGCFAGLAMTKLLLDLIFKINVGVSTASLVWSVSALFVIAALTSGIKVWQAIRTNPVQLLRAE
jgi:ABC-type antimicrobial peptide transport system permease subunit